MSKPHASIHLIACSPQERSITFAVDGKRWEYILPTPAMVDSAVYLARRVSIGKAFAYAKGCAKKEIAA